MALTMVVLNAVTPCGSAARATQQRAIHRTDVHFATSLTTEDHKM